MKPRRVALVTVALVALPSALALEGSYDAPAAPPAEERVVRGGFVVALAFAPDGTAVWGELDGGVKRLAPGAERPTTIGRVPAIRGPEWGLTGLALASDFATTGDVFVAYTTGPEGVDPGSDDVRGEMRISRLHEGNETVVWTTTATRSHNGGRLLAHDGLLFFTNGAHTKPNGRDPLGERAQDPARLEGKVLRMTEAGAPAPGNPAETDARFHPLVWATGFRNPFGMAWDAARGALVVTDPGESSGEKLTFVRRGENGGWPTCTGPCDPPRDGFVDPVVWWDEAITPVGAAVVGRDVYVGAFNDGALHRAYETAEGWRAEIVATHEDGLLDVEASPDGAWIYFGSWDGLFRVPTPAASLAPPEDDDPPDDGDDGEVDEGLPPVPPTTAVGVSAGPLLAPAALALGALAVALRRPRDRAS